LKWSDIDFNGHFITVQRSFSSGLSLSTPKNGKSRRVDISMQHNETLWKLKRERKNESAENDMSECVFPNESGNLMNPDNWRKCF